GFDGDRVAFHLAGDGDFVARVLLHLVLVGDRIDLAIFGGEHGSRSAADAALRTGFVSQHFLLAGAVLVDDVAGDIRGEGGNGGESEYYEQFLHFGSSPLSVLKSGRTTILQIRLGPQVGCPGGVCTCKRARGSVEEVLP